MDSDTTDTNATRGVSEADARVQSMLDSTPVSATLFDREMRVIDCNAEALRMFGIADKEAYLSSFFTLSPERQPGGRNSLERARELIEQAFVQGSLRFEWLHQLANGRPMPCEVTLVRVQHRGERIVVAYAHDVRVKKAVLAKMLDAQRKIRSLAHWYRSILDAIPFPVWVTDRESVNTFLNRAIEDFQGKPLKELLGRLCSDAQLPVCHTGHCALERAKRGEKETFFTNNETFYRVNVETLKDLQGETVGFVRVIQDITQLRRLARRQAEAEAASRAKSNFLAKISHEIRTPMNAILGIAEIQLQDETLAHATREALDKIYSAGNVLVRIINDILDMSKIEAGKLELLPVRYEVASLINDVVHMHMLWADHKPVRFELVMDERVPSMLLGDEIRIKQILHNLLSNAFKYTAQGTVTLAVTAEPWERRVDPEVTLVFRVSDTGEGMTAEQTEHLFDEYTRYNLRANRAIGGTGLGMNITRHLVGMMGGRIAVESVPGIGSTFTVHVPQGNLGAGILEREVVENLRRFRIDGLSRMKQILTREPMPYGSVLVVDDLETNLYVAEGLLAPYDLRIDTATSGREAIEKIKAGAVYDIVFMDHFMPDMDGMEATRLLRELGYTGAVIALTADAVAGQADMFLENGFDGFISKPIDTRLLNATLNRLIRNKQPLEVLEAARSGRLRTHLLNIVARGPKWRIDPKLADIFVREAAKAAATLEATHPHVGREADATRLFVVTIHAMKSALANIGETELSAVASRLEQMGQAGNADTVALETPAFLDALRALVARITPRDAEGSARERKAPDSASAPGMVCIVDDSETNLWVAKNALKDLYRVVALPSAAKLFAFLATARPDCILLDIRMPDMDGLEVLRRLKAQDAYADIPVILLTSLTDTVAETHGFELGAADLIVKPFSPPVLHNRIKTQLDLACLIRERAAQPARQPAADAVTDARLQELVARIRSFDLSHATPMQAMNSVAAWQEMLP